MNQVCLIGRISQNIELRTAKNGSKFVGFSLAVSEYSDGKEFTNFIPCTAWDNRAENMAKFVKKGSLIAVQGRISVRSNQVDGKYETIVNVTTDRVQFLESKSSGSDNTQTNNYSQENVNVNNTSKEVKQDNNENIIVADDDSILWD